MIYAVVPATLAHVRELAVMMRQADVAELAALGHAPLQALEKSLAASRDAYAGLVNGRVVCMFGVAPRSLLSDEAYPWLLASDEMVRHARVFLRLNRPYVAAIRETYRLLHNYVSCDNVAAIRWLRWLGFSVGTMPTKIGPKGALMLHFEMTTHV